MCSNSAGRRVCAAKFCCLPYRSDRRRKSSGQRKPPLVYVSWHLCLSFLVNARVSELGRRGRAGKPGVGKNSLLKQASRERGLRGTVTAIRRHHCSETLRKTLYPSRGSAHIRLEISVHTSSRHNKPWQMKRGRQIFPFL